APLPRRAAEGAAPADDRDPGRGLDAAEQQGEQGVAGLVDRDQLLLLVGHQAGAAGAGQDPRARLVDVLGGDPVAVAAGGEEAGLVDDVGQLGRVEPGRVTGDVGPVDPAGDGPAAGVEHEDLLPAVAVGPVDLDAAVEAAGTEEGGVDQLGPVGGA